MAVFLTFPTAGSYEFLAWASALLSALSDVCGAEGQAFNFVLPLFALYCEWAGSGERCRLCLSIHPTWDTAALWARNPRGIMFTQMFLALTLILDIVFCSVFSPARPPSAIGFVATNMFAKAGLLFFGHFVLIEMGGGYSVTTPTAEATGKSGAGFLVGSPTAGLVGSQVGAAAATHDMAGPGASPSALGGYQSPDGGHVPSAYGLKLEGGDGGTGTWSASSPRLFCALQSLVCPAGDGAQGPSGSTPAYQSYQS